MLGLINYMKCIFGIVLVIVFFLITSSSYTSRQIEYYSNKSNYISAKGEVSNIEYNEDGDVLYITFSNISEPFSDTRFKIVGENLLVVKSNGIDQKVKIGNEVEFISATKYFGDGYVMPIVGLSLEEEVLLEFEVGYDNLIEWLKS